MAELTWTSLQRVALDATHPGWFNGMDSGLLEQARQSIWGRRLLARDLAGSAAPILFGSMPSVMPQAIAGAAWLLHGSQKLTALAFDLGAVAFAPAIRKHVARDDVLRLRRVLGMRRYDDALAHSSVADAVDVDLRSDALDAALESDAGLFDVVYRRGLGEWIGFVTPLHEVAVERLRLTAPPGQIEAPTSRWLGDACVARHLQHHAGATAGAANDGTRSNH